MDILLVIIVLGLSYLGWHQAIRRSKPKLRTNIWLGIISRRMNTATTTDELLDLKNEIRDNYSLYCAGDRAAREEVTRFQHNIESKLDRLIDAGNNI